MICRSGYLPAKSHLQPGIFKVSETFRECILNQYSSKYTCESSCLVPEFVSVNKHCPLFSVVSITLVLVLQSLFRIVSFVQDCPIATPYLLGSNNALCVDFGSTVQSFHEDVAIVCEIYNNLYIRHNSASQLQDFLVKHNKLGNYLICLLPSRHAFAHVFGIACICSHIHCLQIVDFQK